jgi:hypothetical protein
MAPQVVENIESRLGNGASHSPARGMVEEKIETRRRMIGRRRSIRRPGRFGNARRQAEREGKFHIFCL